MRPYQRSDRRRRSPSVSRHIRLPIPHCRGSHEHQPATHTSAYVSIRQHTSAYVSIRQHAYPTVVPVTNISLPRIRQHSYFGTALRKYFCTSKASAFVPAGVLQQRVIDFRDFAAMHHPYCGLSRFAIRRLRPLALQVRELRPLLVSVFVLSCK